MQVFEPSCMPLGISYSRPGESSRSPAFSPRISPVDATSGRPHLRKCLGSNRKHIEGGYCYVGRSDCDRTPWRRPSTVTVWRRTYFGDNKGIAGATSSTWGQRCLVRKGKTGMCLPLQRDYSGGYNSSRGNSGRDVRGGCGFYINWTNLGWLWWGLPTEGRGAGEARLREMFDCILFILYLFRWKRYEENKLNKACELVKISDILSEVIELVLSITVCCNVRYFAKY